MIEFKYLFEGCGNSKIVLPTLFEFKYLFEVCVNSKVMLPTLSELLHLERQTSILFKYHCEGGEFIVRTLYFYRPRVSNFFYILHIVDLFVISLLFYYYC